MSEQTQADLFPLIRGGGLFLAIVGVAILMGALQFRWRNLLLGAGAALAAAVTTATAAYLAAPYGAPTYLQIGSLIVAVLLEIGALIWAIRRFAPQGPRAVTIAVLAIVGAHFVLMAPAFGPLIALLGAITVANALAGVRFTTYSLRALWAADGALKLGFGAAMFVGQLVPGFP
jgi:hypothetical protein